MRSDSLQPDPRLARFRAEIYAPLQIRVAYASLLTQAGHPVSLRALLLGAELSLFFFPAFGLVIALSPRLSWLTLIVCFVVGVIVGALLPWLWIQERIRRRRTDISRELPGTLDLVGIATQSGLITDAAVERVAAMIKGPLGLEMQRTMDAIHLGQPREAAWEAMAARLKVPDVARFCYSIIQSQQLGSGIASALHEQARQIRTSYAQRVRQRSVKISIAMIFPVVFLVLPAIFLSVLGPAIFQLMSRGF